MPCLVHDGEVVVGEGGKDGRGRHVEQELIMAAQRKVRSSVLENTMTPSNCPEQTVLNHYFSFLFLILTKMTHNIRQNETILNNRVVDVNMNLTTQDAWFPQNCHCQHRHFVT